MLSVMICIDRTARMMKQTGLAGLLLAFSTNGFALHVSELLDTMSSADRRLSYQGVFVLRKADRLLSMRVSHAADENGVRETLETLNGEPRRVIRNNDQVISIYPRRKLLIISPDGHKSRLHPGLPENFDGLQSYYDIEQLPEDRIAGRNTAVLQLTPRDALRYGYRYWVDADTGVLLRCDLIDAGSAVIEQMMFTQLEYFDELPESEFALPAVNGYVTRQPGRDRSRLDNVPWRINNLPPGFMLTRSSLQLDGDNRVLHLVYSDGLASVSVFIEQGENDHHYLAGARNMGALNAFGARHGDHYVTVMGEVPANTVRQIASSVEFTGAVTDDDIDDPEPEIGD